MSAVNPILKSENPINIFNYRLISIFYHVAKSFEALVFSFTFYSTIGYIIPHEQHHFQSLWSTTTCNLMFTNYVMNALIRILGWIIYADFSKVFDQYPT